MPRTRHSAMTGTAELNAMIEHVAPDMLALLADGVPRTQAAIGAAVANVPVTSLSTAASPCRPA